MTTYRRTTCKKKVTDLLCVFDNRMRRFRVHSIPRSNGAEDASYFDRWSYCDESKTRTACPLDVFAKCRRDGPATAGIRRHSYRISLLGVICDLGERNRRSIGPESQILYLGSFSFPKFGMTVI